MILGLHELIGFIFAIMDMSINMPTAAMISIPLGYRKMTSQPLTKNPQQLCYFLCQTLTKDPQQVWQTLKNFDYPDFTGFQAFVATIRTL